MHGTVLRIERELTDEDLDLYGGVGCWEALESFWSYRRYVNPHMIVGWWQREVALELHRFWDDYRAGRRPKLLLQSPPQHGKSISVIDFISWIAGLDRNLKIIFTSYSDHLGVRANNRLQRLFADKKHELIFNTPKRAPGPILVAGRQCNSHMIEFGGGDGSFYNTTIEGQITGAGLDIGIIDDPIKGRAEASSQLTRDKTWEWLTDNFLPRFSDRAGLVMILTRWHLDDPAGRLIEQDPTVRVLRYPALAEVEEQHEFPDGSLVVRRPGEPLFPEHKSLEYLQSRRSIMTLAGWESEFQQSPIVAGGDKFPIDKISILPERPAVKDVVAVGRYWDKSGTEGGGAYTAGVLMLRMRDGTFVVCDVRRGQWSALDRERMIKQTAAVDHELYPLTKIFVEQEPGSGGKESAEASIRMLAGYHVEADKVTGSKEVRADPFAAQWQAGNVRLVAAPWNRAYLNEHECLAGDTEVLTSAGIKAIIDVQAGDRVMTRGGWRCVLKAGKTGVQPLCQIYLSSGQQLKTTLGHPIFVPGCGFKRAATLRVGESLLRFIGDGRSGFPATAISGDGLMGGKNFSTGIFGKMKWGRYRPDIISTMWTVIDRTTIHSPIFDVCHRMFIALCRFVANGASVLSVALDLTPQLDGPLAFAQSDVQINCTRSASGSMTSGAKSVGQITRGAGRPGFAARDAFVLAIGLLDGMHDVYNLTVEEWPEFVASGVLVHNCFPAGKYKDQVDASTGAFNKIASKYRYPSDMSWVRKD